jgi:two-component system nitrate/nitrite response regulator NarL
MDTAVLLIVDNNRLFREGLKRILYNRKFSIQNDVDSFAEALWLMQSEKIEFNLVVGDPGLDNPREYEAIDAIRRQFPAVKIVILTDKAASPRSEAALRNGVVGFLSKEISSEALRHSLELVLMGEPLVPIVVVQRAHSAPLPCMTAQIVDMHSAVPRDPPTRIEEASQAALPAPAVEPEIEVPVGLSGRENQILKCLVDGLSNKLIARELNMAEATVKVHLRALLRKLKAQNRTQAAIWAMKNAPTLTRPLRHELHRISPEPAVAKYEALAAAAVFNRLPM